MSELISKGAELFIKALEDIWSSEQLFQGSPNNAVWHCTQAAEKAMKGFLRCLNRDYDYGHDLSELLNAVVPHMDLQPETIKSILYLNGFTISLRYKHMSSDPTVDEAKLAIVRTKQIMQEISANPSISKFVDEARAVHSKFLKANLTSYASSEH